MASPRQDLDSQKVPTSLLSSIRELSQHGIKAEKEKSNLKLPPLAVITASQTSIPANVWHYNKQRQKLKYLTDNTQCVCGAGRDISFLYDASGSGKVSPVKQQQEESLIPEEYHIVKHPGVMGLELHDEPYSTNLVSHERHITTFPSLKPSGRQEVINLKNTLSQMLGDAGIGSLAKEVDLGGPTQMHNLLTLVKKEQEIYNICFHELIRQVTVHCAERGALLADIRQCYANLLSSIPHQVKSLHNEVAAQRALDKKLTLELSRFHGLLASLTSELSELKDHNELAGEEIEETKDTLLLALSESEKNANLLTEYCNLYELQRKRLEDHIVYLSKEKELWEQTSYHLALKVAEQYQLKTVKQLQLNGRSWQSLATHFTIMLADKNTKQLCSIQRDIQKWKNELAQFFEKLKQTEHDIITELTRVLEDMKTWLTKLQQIRSSLTDTSLDSNTVHQLWGALTDWLKALNHLSETFSGEILLDRQDKLQDSRECMSQWSEASLSIVQRRIKPSFQMESISDTVSSSHEMNAKRESITSLVREIVSYMKDLSIRTSGENGIAIAFVHIINPMESWDTKFNLILNGDGKTFSDSDQTKFISQMEFWVEKISMILNVTYSNEQTIQQKSIEYIIKMTDKWCSVFSHGVQVEDNQVIEQVTDLHSSLVQWMAQVLLAMTSDQSELEIITNLKTTCNFLCDNLNTFTNDITKSCQHMLEEMSMEHSSEIDLEVGEERDKLQTLQDEAQDWIRLSAILVETVTETHTVKKKDDDKYSDTEDKMITDEEEIDDTRIKSRQDDVESGSEKSHETKFDETLLETILMIGKDDNVREVASTQLESITLQNQVSINQLDLATEQELPEGRGGQPQEAEKLVLALDEVKKNLIEQELKTKTEQERAETAEKQLKDAEDEITKLKTELQQLQEEFQVQTTPKSTKKTSKGQRSKQESRKK